MEYILSLPIVKEVLTFDHSLTSTLHYFLPQNFVFDAFFSFFSFRGFSKIIWVLALIFYIAYLDEKRDRFIAKFISSTLWTLAMVQIVLKPLFHRLRPPAFGLATVRRCPLDFSFPSSHAAFAFSAAVILSAYDKKRWYVYYSLAFFISFSRIYLGCHYVLDLFTGAIIGFIISQIILHLKPAKEKTT